MNATQEQWLPVVGYEGSFEVSDEGRVRSVDRIVPRRGQRPMPIKGRVLAQFAAPKGGHLWVRLKRGGQGRQFYVHRLMLEAFVGPCPEGMEACHRNDESTDNRLSNLRWDTRSANIHDRYRNGTRSYNSLKTHCKHNHPLSGDNLRIATDGGRVCRECQRTYMKAYDSARALRRRGAASATPEA